MLPPKDTSAPGHFRARPEVPSNDNNDAENAREANMEMQLAKQNKQCKSLSPDTEDNTEQSK